MKVKIDDIITADTVSGVRRQGKVERIDVTGIQGQINSVSGVPEAMIDYRLADGKLAWCYLSQVVAVDSPGE